MKAEIFSIGFGREIAGWTDRSGTRWKLGWLPLGGYVKFAGDMNAASQPSPEWLALPAEERAQTFQAKPVWQRFLIVLAGPVTNFLFAIVIFTGFFIAYGVAADAAGDRRRRRRTRPRPQAGLRSRATGSSRIDGHGDRPLRGHPARSSLFEPADRSTSRSNGTADGSRSTSRR